jgi:hypothetical protein
VDIVVRGWAVQASKPRPLNTVSDGDLGVAAVVAALALAAGCWLRRTSARRLARRGR